MNATTYKVLWVFSPLAAGMFLLMAMGVYAVTSGTKFAPGFSEERFDMLRPGMTEAEVTHLLGEPLRRAEIEEMRLNPGMGAGIYERVRYVDLDYSARGIVSLGWDFYTVRMKHGAMCLRRKIAVD